MKVSPPGKTCVSRFAILVLLLFSGLPATLLTATGAEGSNFRGTLPQNARAVLAGGQLKNCRITSTTPAQPRDTDKSLLQEALKSLVIDVNDAGLVTALCQWQGVAPENPKLTTQSTFQMKGNYNLASVQGTFTWGLNLSGPGNKDNWIDITQLNLRGNGNFKSAGGYIKDGDSVVVHFTISDWYLVDNKGENSQNANATGGVTAFDATFDAVGFLIDTPPSAPAAAPVAPLKISEVKCSSAKGQVEVWPESDKRQRKLVKLTTVFHVGDHIKTREDSSIILNLPDMSTFIMKADTEIVLMEPPEKESRIELMAGRFWANIKKILPDGEMDLDTAQAVCGIKGTTLVVEATDTSTTLKVIEGNVQFTSNSNGQKVMVEGGKTVTANASGLGAKTSFDVAAEQAVWDKVRKEAEAGDTSSAQPAQSTQSSSPQISLGPLKLPHLKVGALSCFIATAAYGSQTAEQLDTLRAFRDKVLLKSEAGTWFVETYYFLSPPLADFIADKDAVRWVVRVELLDPIVFILNNSQQIWNN